MNNKQKLLLVTTVPETLATILRGQPRFLNSRFSVSLATSPAAEASAVCVHEGVPVYGVPMVRGISPFRDLLSIIQMYRLIRRIRPDVVHSYTPKAGLVAMVASKIARVPVRVHTFTGLLFPTQIGLKKKVLMSVDSLICWAATKVVPEGQGVKRDLVAGKITTKRLAVIGSGNIAGVDTSFFSRGSVTSGTDCDIAKIRSGSCAFTFCFIGRLNRDKGVAELAEAFLRLPDEARLLVVGGYDATSPVDENTMRRLEQCPRVSMLGFQEDIRPALLAADVLVLPSYREGFPNVVLQAGAMEVPVIATDISGCNEVIEPGRNGWLVPTRDVDALHAAMCEAMAASKNDLKGMGAAARTIVVENFEQKAHWRRMVEFYEEISGGTEACETT